MDTKAKTRLILFLCFLLCFGYIPYREYQKAKGIVAERQKTDSLAKQTKRFDSTIRKMFKKNKVDSTNRLNLGKSKIIK